MANTYPYGSNVKFSVTFRDPDTGGYVDPTTVRWMIRHPATNVITTWVFGGVGSIVQDSVGHYHADYTLDYPSKDPGWWYRWEADGSYVGGRDMRVCIMESVFA